MTVATQIDRSGPYAGAGTTGPFTVSFRFLDATHLQVIRTDSTGQHILALTTDYTVAGVGNPTGSVTLVAALPVGQTLTIIRKVPKTQEADYVQNSDFPAESHENALDKLTMISQETGEVVSRSITLPTSDSSSLIKELPISSLRAKKALVFGADGSVGVSADDYNDQVANVAASAAAAASSAFSASGSAAAASASATSASNSATNAATSATSAANSLSTLLTALNTFIANLAASAGSSLVGFIQAGSGAIARTVQDKAREIISAADHSTTAQSQAASATAAPTKFWSDETPRPNMRRIPDRMLLGRGAESSGASSQTASESWLYSGFGAYWLERGAQLFVLPQANGYIGQVSAARTSTADTAAGVAIGGASIAWNDKISGGTLLAWAHYFEAVVENGAGATYGAEVAIKNKSSNAIRNPYSLDSSGGIGWWFAGGGDSSYGGAPANPSNVAIAIGKNSSTWNTGIHFDKDGITGADGVTGEGAAMKMAKGHRIEWWCDTSNKGAEIVSSVSAGSGKRKRLEFADNNVFLGNNSVGSLFNFDMVAAAVNGITMSATSSGTNRVVLGVNGSGDTNVDIDFNPKGTGLLRIGNYTAGAPAATGYIQVKDRSGTTFKLLTST